MPETHAISIKNLSKSFGDNKVLTDITFSVPKGTVFALLGPNGAGKTTIVRILTTLLKSDNGTVEINGVNVNEDPDAIRSMIGLTGQNAAVDEKLTGLANLEMIGQLYHISKADAKRRAQELIEQFDLVGAANRPAKTYSGGMRRRLDLAASLITSPPILFLDEPTTGLDPLSRSNMWQIIKDLVANGTTLLLTTQYLEEADQLANEIALINHGKVIAQGTAAELKRSLGGDRLGFTFENEDDKKKASDILKKYKPYTNPENNELTIEVKGGFDELAEIIALLKHEKATIAHSSLHQPTLDDVFISLTGAKTEATA
jgi:ABC-2 type transport system ATP-binding protein